MQQFGKTLTFNTGNDSRAIADGLIKNAIKNPGKPVIIQQEIRITYEQLYERVLKLSQGLYQIMGMQPGHTAAIILPNCPQYIEILLGCSLIGIKVVPIDPRLAPREFMAVLDWLKPRLIFGLGPAKEKLDDYWLRVDSNSYRELFTAASSGVIAHRDDADFFLGLTSGTSGRPKAIARNQSSWAESFAPVSKKFELNENDEMLIPGPLSYSASLVALLLTLHVGGTVRLLDGFNTLQVSQALENATAAFMVPTMYRGLIHRGFMTKLNSRRKRLILLSAGEKLSPEIIKQLVVLPKHIRVFEYYGAAELSFVSTLLPDELLSKGDSVGRPFDEVSVSIRDESGNALPPNQKGGIWVCSPWLARGYVENGPISIQNFRTGWATSGDRGYLDDDGYLHVLGRGDSYVICGGAKVYCAEIEMVLQQHPLVKQAVAVGIPDRNRHQVIAVALESCVSNKDAERELRRYCFETLAPYKRPRHYLLLSELPRTVAGKADRKKTEELIMKKFGV